MKSTIKKAVKGTMKLSVGTLVLLMLSVAAFSQDPGGGPDGPPPAVPFDDYLNLILLAIGIFFSLYAIMKWRISVVQQS